MKYIPRILQGGLTGFLCARFIQEAPASIIILLLINSVLISLIVELEGASREKN